jgi:hypothetical protein
MGLGITFFAFTRDFYRTGLVAIGLIAPTIAVFRHDIPTIALAAVTSLLCLAMNHPIVDARRAPRTG